MASPNPFASNPSAAPPTLNLFDLSTAQSNPSTTTSSFNNNNNTGLQLQELEFKTIAHNNTLVSPKLSQPLSANGAVQFSDYALSSDRESLLGSQPSTATRAISNSLDRNAQDAADPNASFYSLAYYRRYFDVTTALILTRLRKAMLPIDSGLFFESLDLSSDSSFHNTQPDMYAPFWIVNTLIVVLAARGNFASWMQFMQNNNEDSNAQWKYHFNAVTVGASIYYAVLFVVPVIVYFALNRVNQPLPLIHVMSIFGYSLVNYIPLSALLLIPLSFVQWILVSVTVTVASLFVAKNVWLERQNKQVMPIVLACAALQAALGLLTKLYFFG